MFGDAFDHVNIFDWDKSDAIEIVIDVKDCS